MQRLSSSPLSWVGVARVRIQPAHKVTQTGRGMFVAKETDAVPFAHPKPRGLRVVIANSSTSSTIDPIKTPYLALLTTTTLLSSLSHQQHPLHLRLPQHSIVRSDIKHTVPGIA
jgi:hypothetical protein